MYIIKNAFRCIGRSMGRNILIGIIALVIAVSACIGLSIRQASMNAKESALEGMSVTATISFDRSSMMSGMGGFGGDRGQGGGFDRDQFASMMGRATSLTLEEYEVYAEADSVEDFYYTLTAYFNGSENLEPVSDETDDESSDDSSNSSSSSRPGFPGMGGGMMMGGGMFTTGDFTIVGYSSDVALTDFVSGNASIVEDGGTMFEEGTTEAVCVISEELAIYNDLAVGDIITITNPSLEDETYELTVCGIYTSSANNDFSMSMFGAGQDPANKILMSSAALQEILAESEENSTTVTDENTGRETESAIAGTLDATYSFADADSYYAFEEEARDLGLSEDYTISSSDLTSFENSLTPLTHLAPWQDGSFL